VHSFGADFHLGGDERGPGNADDRGRRLMSAASLFAEAHRWTPEPAPEAGEDAGPCAVELAIHLLRSIAEDPLLRGQQRVAARRYLRRLEQERAEP
jgi:hypothetical protein